MLNKYKILGGGLILIIFLGIFLVRTKSDKSANKNEFPALNISSSPTNSISDNKTAGDAVKGIVVYPDNAFTLELFIFDPDSGTSTTRTFNFWGYHKETEKPVTFTNVFGINADQSIRQVFNNDFTGVAGTLNMPDGSRHVGYMNTAGKFFDLTPVEKSDFGTLPKYDNAIFNPATQRIWFNTATKMASVDPDANPPTITMETYNAITENNAILVGKDYSFHFGPDGKKPVPDYAQHYSKDGKIYVYTGFSGSGVDVIESETGKKLSHLNTNCAADDFIDNTSFLCVHSGGSDSDQGQIYKATLSSDRSELVMTPLLPENNHRIIEAITDKTGQRLAFIASSGGKLSLYHTTMGGNGESKKLGDIRGNTAVILAWE